MAGSLTFSGPATISCRALILASASWMLNVGINPLAGWLLPKPRWVDRGLKAKALLLASPPGLWFRRVAVAAHLSLIVREVWRNLFAPGTFRGVLRAAWLSLTTGQRFAWPAPSSAASSGAAAEGPPAAAADSDSWYVGAKDLAEFKWTIDADGRPAGASDWEPMMQKSWPGCTYTAWRRTLPSGKSEYKSVTVSEDATAEEFMDFYLDDETRMTWDSLISETQLLESGHSEARCQVVRWLRTFPFAFISQREYVIARRFFRDADGALYAVTKGVEHPAAPRLPGVVRMEDFHSCWRSRTVPCPRGSGRPAVETTLLHFEDFKIPERLARFAVRHGMAGFVKGMIPAVERFVAARRQRCPPHAEDPASFGRRQLLVRRGSLGGLTGLGGVSPSSGASLASESVCSVDDSASDRSFGAGSAGSSAMARSPSMRRLGAVMLASGVAIALARTASGSPLGLASSGPGAGAGAGRQHAGGKRHGGHRHRQHSHGHGSHKGEGASRGEAPSRHRRRRAEVEPAMLAAAQA